MSSLLHSLKSPTFSCFSFCFFQNPLEIFLICFLKIFMVIRPSLDARRMMFQLLLKSSQQSSGESIYPPYSSLLVGSFFGSTETKIDVALCFYCGNT